MDNIICVKEETLKKAILDGLINLHNNICVRYTDLDKKLLKERVENILNKIRMEGDING